MGLKKRSKVSAEFSMSSLTDIIFLLLIFFMLTSNFVKQNALNLKLPSSNSETVAPRSVSVSIKKGGKYYLNTTPMSFSNLSKAIRSEIGQQSNNDKATITILAERGAEIEHVVRIMDLANKMGISAILATEPTG